MLHLIRFSCMLLAAMATAAVAADPPAPAPAPASAPAPAQTAPTPAADKPATPAAGEAKPAAEAAPTPPTDDEIAKLNWDDAMDDNGFVAPFARNFDNLKDSDERRKDWEDFTAKLDMWEPGKVADQTQRVRNLISVAALMDVGQGQFEAETPLLVFQRISHEMSKEALTKLLAMMVFHPEAGKLIETAPELDLNIGVGDEQVRERLTMYAKKMLGRLLGKLPVDPR